MKNATELFGARLRELRKRSGLTQEQLADVLGIEQKHVSLMEHGKSYPSLDRLIRIAETLKVPLPGLFEFMHLADEFEQVGSIEQMLGELDRDVRKKAFKVITAVIKSFKED
ncbi:MAG: helix-turn-helix transcriptional regulator [Trichlorobacter sp.]|nr:helix-turn-helix transcriptional regulator [Trichlorobacter sp.]